MGYDFRNKNGDTFRGAGNTWSLVVKLAHCYGWEPAGTTIPVLGPDTQHGARTPQEADEWRGAYCANNLQIVNAEDARAMASAVERALPDIPNQDVIKNRERFWEDTGDLFNGSLVVQLQGLPGHDFPSREGNLLEVWSGSKDYLREFIAFARKGEFDIV